MLVEAVSARRPSPIDLTIPGKILRLVMYKPFMKRIPKFGKKFIVSPSCNGCLACLQFCPFDVISCGGKTSEWQRYCHPEVTIVDMKAQKCIDANNPNQ